MIVLQIILSVLLMSLWFWLILEVAKRTVGKEASLLQMFLFLLIAGPVGWATVLIVIVYSMIEKRW
jgi:hypothetical protein